MKAETLRQEAIAFASLVFGLASSATYLLERLYERSRTLIPSDPRSIIYEPRTIFYWRVVIALWFGGAVALIAYRGVRNGFSKGALNALLIALLVLCPVAVVWSVRFP